MRCECSTKEVIVSYRFLVGNMKEKNYLEDPGVDGRIIIGLIFRKWDGGH
jgi:hypothetical protein